MERKEKSKSMPERRKEWAPMRVSSLGKATDLIKGGGGKLSVSAGDTGDTRKNPGQG
jgi:hypothetical protein